jgi:hypothetical protein
MEKPTARMAQKAHLLADVEEVGGIDEVVRRDAKEGEQDERRDGGAVGGEDVSLHGPSGRL